jgi:hypothetical protein
MAMNATIGARDASTSGEFFMRRLISLLLAIAVLAAVPAVYGQGKKKGSDQTRSVQGAVNSADDAAVNGAVVQLKNTKTLQIRSFITRDNGAYYFHGLSPDVDYELKADYDGASSGTKTLSSFDNRKEAIINLKLNPRK